MCLMDGKGPQPGGARLRGQVERSGRTRSWTKGGCHVPRAEGQRARSRGGGVVAVRTGFPEERALQGKLKGR